jgi:hypothetical protein
MRPFVRVQVPAKRPLTTTTAEIQPAGGRSRRGPRRARAAAPRAAWRRSCRRRTSGAGGRRPGRPAPVTASASAARIKPFQPSTSTATTSSPSRLSTRRASAGCTPNQRRRSSSAIGPWARRPRRRSSSAAAAGSGRAHSDWSGRTKVTLRPRSGPKQSSPRNDAGLSTAPQPDRIADGVRAGDALELGGELVPRQRATVERLAHVGVDGLHLLKRDLVVAQPGGPEVGVAVARPGA